MNLKKQKKLKTKNCAFEIAQLGKIFRLFKEGNSNYMNSDRLVPKSILHI